MRIIVRVVFQLFVPCFLLVCTCNALMADAGNDHVKEAEYYKKVSAAHVRQFGQFFTDPRIADFMCRWACRDAESVLDPALGNSVFLLSARKVASKARLVGYEIDPIILQHFGNPASAEIHESDFLTSCEEARYDAIVANPPYGRFQNIHNRDEIIQGLQREVPFLISKYTNLSILFLYKAIGRLSTHGRLAFLIPSEFLNSRYGTPIKRMLVDNHLLRAVVNFDDDRGLFDKATTTCCMLFLDREAKNTVLFASVKSIAQLESIADFSCLPNSRKLLYTELTPESKWRLFFQDSRRIINSNVVHVSTFCSVSRGIATGDNDYFCLSQAELDKNSIPSQFVKRCICRSADVETPVFSSQDFDALSRSGKKVFILDVKDPGDKRISAYISQGIARGINLKYLPSTRRPWCSMENKKPAPIFISTASRNGLKVVRNLADVNSLTTFHSVYMKPGFENGVDLLFCYFLTPLAQDMLRENCKKLGAGLEKFQPSDVNDAFMIDLRRVTPEDRHRIAVIYQGMTNAFDTGAVSRLADVFSSYFSASD